MGMMKRFAERVSLAMKLEGEITDEVRIVAQLALDIKQAYIGISTGKAISNAVKEWQGV